MEPVGTREALQVLGVSSRTLERWSQEGCPFIQDGKRKLWDVSAVAAWMTDHHKGEKAKGKKSGETDKLKAAKIRKETALAQMYELDLGTRCGELVSRSENELATCRKFIAVRNAMLSIPSSIAAQLVGLDENAIRERLTAAVDHALSELANGAQGNTGGNGENDRGNGGTIH